jgi:hypothetical protein
MFCNLYNTSCHYLQSIVYNDKRLHMKEKKRKEKKHFVACSLSLSVFFRERKPFQISLRSSGEVTAAVWCPHGLIWPSSWSWRPWFLTASSGGLGPQVNLGIHCVPFHATFQEPQSSTKHAAMRELFPRNGARRGRAQPTQL